MAWNIIFFLETLIFIAVHQCSGSKRVVKYKMYKNTYLLEGLACAVNSSYFTKGVRFDPQAGDCTALDDDWYEEDSRNYQAGMNYFELLILENIIQETNSLEMNIPSGFGLGCTIRMYLKTGTVNNNQFLSLQIKNSGGSITSFLMEVRESEGVLLFNTYKDSQWGEEERLNNPLESSNQIYVFEFEITDTKVFIGGTIFHGYGHRTSISNYQLIDYISSYTDCERIEFIYPAYNDGPLD